MHCSGKRSLPWSQQAKILVLFLPLWAPDLGQKVYCSPFQNFSSYRKQISSKIHCRLHVYKSVMEIFLKYLAYYSEF